MTKKRKRFLRIARNLFIAAAVVLYAAASILLSWEGCSSFLLGSAAFIAAVAGIMTGIYIQD